MTITDDPDATAVELRSLVGRIEQLLEVVPAPLVANDAYGNPGLVAAGELIESAWGNAVVNRTMHIFPDVAAMNTWAAPDGAIAQAPAGVHYTRIGGVWRAFPMPPVSRTDGTMTFSTTSVAAQQIPNLAIAITPRSSASRFLLRASLLLGASSGTDDVAIFFMNGLTPIAISTGATANCTAAHRFNGAAGAANNLGLDLAHITIEYLWSPNTAALINFGVAIGVRVNTMQVFLNRRGADASVGGISTFTVQELP